ncbi:MAG: AI-2E family transporter [Actinomycetota bacterium]|nr:AI-2E family transporter [Actinomycetota bacterium]
MKGDDGARVAAEAAAGAVAAARSAETQAREVAKEAHAAAAMAERAASIAADHEHRERERRLLDELGVDVDAPEVEAEINRLQAGVSETLPFGRPGRPLPPDSAFRFGFVAALGVVTALLLVRVVLSAAPILLLVGMALFLAVGLDPAVAWLHRRGLARGWAVFAIVLAVVVPVGAFLAAAVPPLVAQASGLQTELPEFISRLQQDNAMVRELDERFDVVERFKAMVSMEPASGSTAFGGVLGVARGVFSAFASTLTVIVLALYFLASLPNLKRTSYRLVPRSRRARFSLLADEVLARIGDYLLGNVVTSLIAGVVAFVFFTIAGVPYPLPLAVFVALADLVPLVGATIGSVVSVLVAFLVSVPVGIATIVFSFVYQQFENFVLAPRVMKRTVDVTPLTTIVAALIGATLLGIFGALLAVPVAASIQIIGRHVLLPRQEAA